MHRHDMTAKSARFYKSALSELLLWAVALTLSCSALTANAAPIPWREQAISIVAREQPLRDFLQDLFSTQGLSVSVSNSVKGSVNGNLSGNPQKVFNDVTRAYGLIAYYDKSVVYVYSASEATTRVIPVAPGLITNVVHTMSQLEIYDARNTFRALVNDGLISLNGTKRFVEQVEELTRTMQMQSSSGPASFRLFPLKFAWASDVVQTYAGKEVLIPGVATLLRSLLASPSRTAMFLDGNERARRPVSGKLKGKGLRAIGDTSDAMRPADPNVAPAAVEEYPAPAIPLSVPSGGDVARVEADKRMNAIIVRDSADRMPFYEQLIASLDVEPFVIEIEATIIDVSSDRARDVGVNWRFNNSRAQGLFGRGDASDLNLKNQQDITQAGKGLFLSTILGDKRSFIARINALAEEGNARIVAHPQVITLSNVEAIVENNKTFYVRVQGFQEVDLFNVTAGTTMRVTPHAIMENGKPRIRLLVAIDDGMLSEQTVDAIPVVDRSSINTQALISEGESLLIGGLVREASTKNVSKIPLLGDVPIVGHLFRNTSENNSRSERLFLISPRVVSGGGAERAAAPDLQRQSDPSTNAASGLPKPASNPSARSTATRPWIQVGPTQQKGAPKEPSPFQIDGG